MTRYRIVMTWVSREGYHFTVERRRSLLGLSWWSVVKGSYAGLFDIEVRPIRFDYANEAITWIAEETGMA